MKKHFSYPVKSRLFFLSTYPGISVFFCFVSFMAFAQPAVASAFTLVKTENNISLYEREVEHANMKVREVKVEIMVNANAASLIAFLKNTNQIQQWNKKICLAEIVPSTQYNTWITYTKIDLPWPLSDQDMVMQYKIQAQNDQSALITFNSVKSPLFPEKESISRVNHVAGSWQLIPVGDKSAKVVYCIRSERKSSIPRSISDPFIRDNLMESMKNLKSILEHKI